MNCSVGIDIGGTNFRIGTVWDNGELTNFEKKSSTILGEDNAEYNLFREIENYIVKHDLYSFVKAITIGVPSCVSKDKSKIITTPNLKGLEDVDLKNYLFDKLSIPIFLERDVNFLILNDIKENNLNVDEDTTILGMYVGTGFGNALLINGKLFSGKNGVAGELGHIPLYNIQSVCGCGNLGCSECRASGWYLKSLKDKYFSDTDMNDLFTKHFDNEHLVKFVDDIALVVATEINILDPDYVIFAGGVISMNDFPKEQLKMAVNKRLRKPYPFENIEYIFTNHNQESGIKGGNIYIGFNE